MINAHILCEIYIYAQVLHIVKHAFCNIKQSENFTADFDQFIAKEKL